MSEWGRREVADKGNAEVFYIFYLTMDGRRVQHHKVRFRTIGGIVGGGREDEAAVSLQFGGGVETTAAANRL